MEFDQLRLAIPRFSLAGTSTVMWRQSALKECSMLAPDFAPIKIYVIERQSLMSKALRALLNEQPTAHVVGDATTLDPAELTRTRPDMLLYGLDNAVNDLSVAIELARSVCPKLRICVLSSHPSTSLLQRCMTAGADGFLLKDIGMNELDVALRVLSAGSCYVDPRLAGRMLHRRGQSTKVYRELSPREAEVLRFIAEGLANKEIGVRLQLSEKTIKNYISGIFVKINVSARTQAAVYAIKAGIA